MNHCGTILGKSVDYLDIVYFKAPNGIEFCGSYLGNETVGGAKEHVFINNIASNQDSAMFRLSERYLEHSNIRVEVIHG